MKLLRYGPKGQEKPGLLDAQGRVRDLSAHVADIAGDAITPVFLRAGKQMRLGIEGLGVQTQTTVQA